MKRFLILAMVLVIAAGTLMAGGGRDTTPTRYRDSITIGIISEWATLDPRIANDLLAFTVTQQFFDTLVLLNQTDNTLKPGLATHWTVSDDGLVYTFFLREGVRFHNGDTFSADDVVFSFDRAVASPPTARITGSIARTERIDDMTVQVTLRFPYEPFLACVTMPNLAIVSPRAVREMGDAAFARNPVGTGPYRFVEWRPGDRLVMEAFEDYWRGPARIRHAQFRVIPDASTQTIALERGEIDMILSVVPSERQNIINNRNLVYNETASASPWFIAFHMQQGMFTNRLLRQAVAYAMNPNEIIIGALEGIGMVINAPMSPDAFGYPHGFQRTPYDPARARQLLSQAGFSSGPTITIRTMESPNYARPVAIIQEQLRRVGFDARVDLMERGAFLTDAFTHGMYEIMFISLTALIPDADMITFTRFHSSHQGGGMNFSFLNMPEMDRLLEASRASQDPEERLRIFWEIYELNRDEVIYVPLYVGMNGVATVNGLRGVYAHMAQRYFIYDFWWE